MGQYTKTWLILLSFLAIVAATPTTTRSQSPGILVAWGGDTMLGRGVMEGMAQKGHEDPLIALHDRLKAVDLRIGNMEGPLTTQKRVTGNPYNLTAPPDRVAVLTAAGFDVMNVANNHATDHGRTGLTETLKTLHDAGIVTFGAGANQDEAYGPAYIERGGVRLALLGYNNVGGSHPADRDAPGVAVFSVDAARRGIAAARDKADVVIVEIHWGIEYMTQPTPAQRQMARALVEAGADAVICHHPHVVQPVEWIARPGRNPAFVAYSLGNFLFDSKFDDSKRGMLLETLITREGVMAFRAVPTHTHWLGVTPLADPPSRDALTARLFPDKATRASVQLSPDGQWWAPSSAPVSLKVVPATPRPRPRPMLPWHGPVP